MFKGQLDAAPFACVLFCLLIFLLLGLLVPIPGIRIHLPDALPGEAGVEGDIVTVALDVGGPQNPHGIIYFENQIISEQDLQRRLTEKVKKSRQPLTLVVQMDKAVTIEQRDRLYKLAEQAGLKDLVEQTRPGIFEATTGAKGP
jgi:biopolymer transport protein ExbD